MIFRRKLEKKIEIILGNPKNLELEKIIILSVVCACPNEEWAEILDTQAEKLDTQAVKCIITDVLSNFFP